MAKYATLEEVISTAQTVVKASDNFDRNIWRQWVWMANLELGISDDDIKTCILYPKYFVAKLPDDCRYIIEVVLYDASGSRLHHKFRSGKKRIFNNTSSFVSSDGEGSLQYLPVDVSSDAYNIYLGSNSENVASIAIRYFGYPLDQNGLPMIKDEDIMACVYYIRYMQALRDDDNRSKIEQDQVNWFREADRARARKKMASMTPDKARSILSNMMSLLPNFRQIGNF